MQVVAVLPQWKVRVQKSKAVQMVLNLCSPSVTDKCLIAEAWCPVAKLPELQSALREGGVRQWQRQQHLTQTKWSVTLLIVFTELLLHPQRKSGSGVDSFYNRLPSSVPPPTLFPINSFSAGFQNIVDAYGVASYREVNPGTSAKTKQVRTSFHYRTLWRICVLANFQISWAGTTWLSFTETTWNTKSWYLLTLNMQRWFNYIINMLIIVFCFNISFQLHSQFCTSTTHSLSIY